MRAQWVWPWALVCWGVTAIANAEVGSEADRAISTGSPLDGFGAAVQAEFSQEEKTGVLKFGGRVSATQGWFAGAELKAPFDKSSGSSEFADFDGLGQASTLKLALSRRSFFGDLSVDAQAKQRVCREFGKRLGAAAEVSNCDDATIRRLATEQFGKLPANGPTAGQRALCHDVVGESLCTAENYARVVVERYSVVRRQNVGVTGKVGVVALSGEIGRSRFDYRESDTLEKSSVHKAPFKVSLAGGVGFGEHMLGGGVEFVRQHKASPESEFCQPRTAPAGSLDCASAPVGPPSETERHNVFVEWRARKRNRRAAMAPRISYDLKSDEYAVRLPVYLIGHGVGPLNGGVRLEWDSLQRDINGILFVGRDFSFALQ